MSEQKSMEKGDTQSVHIGPKQVEIPKHWRVTTIDSINSDGDPICYGVLKPGPDTSGGIPLIKIEDLESNKLAPPDSVHHISEDLHEEFSRSKISGGEVLISVQGTIGRVGIVPDDYPEANISRTVARITPNEQADPVWLKNFLLSNESRIFMEIVSSGSTRSSLNIGTLRNMKAFVPPLPEQRRIADILSTVDEQIQQTKETIEKTKELKRGLSQDFFRPTTPDGQSTKFGDVPNTWKAGQISDFGVSFTAGGTPSREHPEYFGGKIPWLKTSEVQNCRVSSSEEFITEAGLKASSATVVSSGSVLVAMYGGGTVGNVGLLEIEAATNQACCAINTEESTLNSEFLYYQLLFEHRRLVSYAAGSSQQNLSKHDVEQFDILVPPQAEQEQIAEVLRAVDNKLEAEKEHKQQLIELKKGLTQDLLTGKVRVNAD
jgi:type I restriction enzyme S subunit